MISRDVPPGALAAERAPQDVKEGWTRTPGRRPPGGAGPPPRPLTSRGAPASRRHGRETWRGVRGLHGRNGLGAAEPQPTGSPVSVNTRNFPRLARRLLFQSPPASGVQLFPVR